jgi:hypothetical protein
MTRPTASQLRALLRVCPLKADMAPFSAALDAVEAAIGDVPGKTIFDANRGAA